VKPDRARTTITVTRPQPGTFVIAVTPRDQFGNDLGPGYGSLVKARLNGTGRVSGPVDNDSTGTYVFTIVEAAGSTLDVEIIVDGVVMGNPGRK
jgi:hypothetical protein